GYIFSLGLLPILFYWKPEWDVWCQCVPCNLENANVVLLRTTDDFKMYCKKKVCWVQPFRMGEEVEHNITADAKSLIRKAIIKPGNKIRYIRVQRIQYVWNTFERKFEKIGVLEDEYSCSQVHSKFGSGFSNEEQEIRKQICGLNTIDVEVIPIWKLLFKEVLNPFYIFQAFALSMWLAMSYIEYSIALIIITLLSMGATVYTLRMQSIKLHNLVEVHNNTMVSILRRNGEVESSNLVPGDTIIITEKRICLSCDAVLITGGCIVNEGMLTGESLPVTKTPLPNINNSIPWKVHSGEDYKRHVLFCGTEVIQTKPSANCLIKAVVSRTGFNTAKGDLVRSILYPKPVNFKLHRDVRRFLMGLIGITVIGVIYTIISHVKNEVRISIMFKCTAIKSIPAALPVSITVCILYSQMRLQKSGIFCLSTQRINMCGQLNMICFDKTGTLTEDGMELWGILPSNGECFQDVHFFTPGNTLPWGPLVGAMVSCHSLILLDGVVLGDPLDLKMFEGTKWVTFSPTLASYLIIKPGPDAGIVSVALLHQFPFSSNLQRMSVIARVIGEDELLVFLKGAPEMVVTFCKPGTVPYNFQKELEYCTSQGFRVIALAYKVLTTNNSFDAKSLERDDVESDLTFLGLLIMENKLKPETKPVLEELNAANIRSVMITGDNLQTACTVARTSGMIHNDSKLIVVEANNTGENSAASISWKTVEQDEENRHINHNVKTLDFHFAMNGKTYKVIEEHFYELLPKILLNGTVFARMSPGQKSNLIEQFQKLDYYAGMCGDGANDCGALKVAHAGISLSELEASVASPFTSKTPNIECITKLIKEGRNCLVTSFGMFKYIAMYALTELISMMLLFWVCVLGNHHYLMLDIAISFAASLTSKCHSPAETLASYRPSGQLIAPPLLLSIILNFIFSLIIQTIGFTQVQQQPWYNDSDVFSIYNVTVNVEPQANQNILTTTMWFINSMNIIILEFVYSKGKPFRKPIYTNCKYSSLAAFIFVYFADIESVYHAMAVGTIISRVCSFYLLQEFFIENRKLWTLLKRLFNYKSKSKYRILQRLVNEDPHWPPHNRKIYSLQENDKEDIRLQSIRTAPHIWSEV
uniref:Cation-transporting ATPase n=1 Tax=Leptobrachium leishanense TaxID=445787 RepID=A0A8C5WFV6_9ANUR